VTGHLPGRGTWLCTGCGREWPCGIAKAALRREYHGLPVALCLYLTVAFAEACTDLAANPAGELYQRFLGWLRW
jgi:hypothetical protein